MNTLVRSSSIKVPIGELTRWEMEPAALVRLLPGWMGAEVTQLPKAIAQGAECAVQLSCGLGRHCRWVTSFDEIDASSGFTERMVEGPLPAWALRRHFRTESTDSSRLEEEVRYKAKGRMPWAALGTRRLEATLLRLLDWRHQRARNDLARHQEVHSSPRCVLVTGSSGLVGTQLCAFLKAGGHTVRRFVRRTPVSELGEFQWDPSAGTFDERAFDGVDAVVHLAGAGIADKRWSEERKRIIVSSRVDSTRLLASHLATLSTPPALVCASAVGFYGNRPEGFVTEQDSAGSNFLADTCVAWEGAADPARDAGIRVSHLRIGVVVAAAGGAVAKLRLPVTAGVAGPLGTGRQGMSWIALDDVLGVVLHAIVDERYAGPINVVAPEDIDNRSFMRAMGRVLKRPTVAPMPAMVARMLFGQLGEEALLGGAFVRPQRLQELGYRFEFSDLEHALRFELGRVLG